MSQVDPDQALAALVVAKFGDMLLANFCSVAATTLLFYDYTLTFSQEIKFIWRRKFSAATVLFLLNRYVTLIYRVLMMVDMLPWQNQPQETANKICESVLRTTQVLTIVLQLVIAGFTSLRMYAIWQKDRKILALVLFLGLVPAGVNMYYYTTLTIVSSPSPFTGCGEYVKLSMNVTDILGIFNCVFAIFSDSVVLVLTWLKTYKIRRTFSKLHMKGGLVELLQRDGTIYFLALLILNVINVVAIRASQAFGSIPALTEVLTSILISRFILNLRGVHISSSGTGSQLSSTAHLSRFSGVYFASNMAGNLGAPLGNSLTGADEGTELTSEDEEEPALISDDPLMTGLLAEPDDKGSVVELKLTDIYDSHV